MCNTKLYKMALFDGREQLQKRLRNRSIFYEVNSSVTGDIYRSVFTKIFMAVFEEVHSVDNTQMY